MSAATCPEFGAPVGYRPTVPSMHDLDVALHAARAGAAVVRSYFGGSMQPDFKGSVDPVTAADREAEAAVLEVIGRHRPGDAVLSEEAGAQGGDGGPRLWVVDPLDGTVNFIHGVPQCAVAVALQDDSGPRAAAIVDVLRGEEFSAARGSGAQRDGRPIAISPQSELRRSLLSTGFPYDRHLHPRRYTDLVAAVLQVAQGVRRSGSACLDLAWVACGRYEAHWEYNLQPWDVAAGILLVTEAGGRVSNAAGGPAHHTDLVASNGHIHEALLAVLAAHRPPPEPTRGAGP